ncbi:MAG: hypothetical protein GF344_02815 [Chitinivibrionales bacterium]|nr:hypothetical protein [Chitinivibrionales bacterium]MBD3356013.1 hypothetical protein [Chitinivibrionales bacterium]
MEFANLLWRHCNMRRRRDDGASTVSTGSDGEAPALTVRAEMALVNLKVRRRTAPAPHLQT